MSEEKGNILKKLKVDQLIEHLIGYVDTKIAITKLDIEERVKGILASIIQNVFILILLFSGILFLSVALAFFLSQVFNNTYLGFGVVAILYLLLTTLFMLDKDKKIGSKIADKIFKSNDKD